MCSHTINAYVDIYIYSMMHVNQQFNSNCNYDIFNSTEGKGQLFLI